MNNRKSRAEVQNKLRWFLNRKQRNGLSQRVNMYQFISWIVFLYNFIIFLIFLIPASLFISTLLVVFISLVYVILTILVIVYAFIAMIIDPTDPRVIYETQWKLKGQEPKDADDLIYYCDVCESFVHERTKHWGDCNRCCESFDHHCIWLNNWVGKSNYKYFIILVIILKIQTWISVWFSFITLLTVMINTDSFHEGYEEIYGSEFPVILVLILIIISNIFNTLILVFTTTLLRFHYKLRKMGISTYEYITYNREK